MVAFFEITAPKKISMKHADEAALEKIVRSSLDRLISMVHMTGGRFEGNKDRLTCAIIGRIGSSLREDSPISSKATKILLGPVIAEVCRRELKGNEQSINAFAEYLMEYVLAQIFEGLSE